MVLLASNGRNRGTYPSPSWATIHNHRRPECQAAKAPKPPPRVPTASSGEAPGRRRWRWSPPHLHSPGEPPGLRRGGGAHRISIPLERRLAAGVAAVEPTASPFPWRTAWPQAWRRWSPPHLHSPGEAPGLRRGRWSPPHLHQTAGGGAHRISTRPAVEPTASPPDRGRWRPTASSAAGTADRG
jgi:hypothetical protein